MRNKIVISVIFLICIFFIPSFCRAITFEDKERGRVVTCDDLPIPDGAYVWAYYYPSPEYYMFSISSHPMVCDGNRYRTDYYYEYYVYPDGSCKKWVERPAGWEILYRENMDLSMYIYANFDIVNGDGDILLGDTTSLKLNLSILPDYETSNVPVLVCSEWYLLDKWNTSLEVFTENQMYDVYMHIPQVEDPVRY